LIDAVSLDSTIVKVHPDGCGTQKKGVQATGRSRGGLTTKIHLIAASDEWAVTFRLSGGNAEDAGEGRLLMEELGPIERPAAVLMDRAYADWKTWYTAWELRFKPVVPPKRNMKYDKTLYKRRNEVERLFRRLKSWTCKDKCVNSPS
jgi:transposase